MKDKILAILEKEAPGIEWSIEDWPFSENTLWLKGQIPITMWGQFIEVDCVLGLDIVLDSDGNIKLKEFYPYIDLTGKGPVYSRGSIMGQNRQAGIGRRAAGGAIRRDRVE